MMLTVEEINKKLKVKVAKYSMIQAIRVSATYLKMFHKNESFDKLYERLIFSSNKSLSFQKSEVHNIEVLEVEDGINIVLTINFLGLFGSSSPLPSHYSEMVLRSYDDDKVLHDFLNLFNNRIQKLVYHIWERNRYYVQYQNDLEDKFTKYMLSIMGLYEQYNYQTTILDLKKLLPFIGVLAIKHKSVGTLTALLRNYFEHDDIEIEQFIPNEIEISKHQQNKLGLNNSKLGSSFLIGSSLKTRSGKFKIIINNITWDQLYDYSSTGKKMQELDELIKLSLNEPLDYEVSLYLKDDQIEPFTLNNFYLGVNTYMGNEYKQQEIIAKN